MANRTDPSALTIHGSNPQFLIEKIVRNKIYDSRYWKEMCFGLTAETLIDKAVLLDHVGGTYGGNRKPTKFLCLILKMLQIQPEKEIVAELIKNWEFKYVRLLGALYLRLVGRSVDLYQYLEPLLNDYRKIRKKLPDGKYIVTHVDEVIDELLRTDYAFDIALPTLPKRTLLEAAHQLEPRHSDVELIQQQQEAEAEEGEAGGKQKAKRKRKTDDDVDLMDRFDPLASSDSFPSSSSSSSSSVSSSSSSASYHSSHRSSHRRHHSHHSRNQSRSHSRSPPSSSSSSSRHPRNRDTDEDEELEDRKDEKLNAEEKSMSRSSSTRRSSRSRSHSPPSRHSSSARHHRRSPSLSSSRSRGRSRSQSPSAGRSRGGPKTEEVEIAEANKLRASLGAKPLRVK